MRAKKQFYKVRELVERWRVTDRHIRKMAADGRLKVARIGSAIRIPLSEVLRIEKDL